MSNIEAEVGDPEVNAIHAAYRRRVDEINADGNLTLAGKTAAVQQLADAANGQIDALREAFTKSVVDERRRLERSILAPPALPLGASASDRIARDASFRDGLDRAGRTSEIDPAELVVLMQRAQRSGDSIQARAALTVAFERLNLDAINLYLTELPDNAPEAADIHRLWTLMTTENDIEAKLRDSWRFQGV